MRDREWHEGITKITKDTKRLEYFDQSMTVEFSKINNHEDSMLNIIKHTIMSIIPVLCLVGFNETIYAAENPYPVFIPYVDTHDTVAKHTENLDIRTLRLEQPTRWLTPDPLADKYPGWSPYVYVLNNPLRYIDPDGMEVQICTEEEEDEYCITYVAGMTYEGENENISIAVNTLNRIYSTGIGSEVLSTVIDTENIYTVMIHNYWENPSYKDYTINLDWWLAKGAESVAHELFHAYQDEMGSQGPSIMKEVEALLFGAAVSKSLGEHHLRFGIIRGNNFDIKMRGLLDSQTLSQSSFDTAISLFINESRVNVSGHYNHLQLVHPRNRQLIQNLYPLIRR